MIKKTVFRKWWIGLFIVITVVAAIASIVLGYFLKSNWSYLLLSGIFIFPILFWSSRLEVPPEFTTLAEWYSQKMTPFYPGVYYPFRYFGLFKEIVEIPMNKQTIHILSGERKGFPDDIIEKYAYGVNSNIEPNTGDFLRLLYRLEFKCIDPLLLYYNFDDSYDYIAGLVEQCVIKYVHNTSSEDVIDNFTSLSINSPEFSGLKDQVLNETGIEIISFIPIDVVNTPEVEEIRRELDQKERQLKIIEAQAKNEAAIETGRAPVLKAKANNLNIEKEIADQNNSILTARINSVMTSANVQGVEALNFIAREKTLETINEASENGGITYIDDSSKGNLPQAAAMSFAINANQKK